MSKLKHYTARPAGTLLKLDRFEGLLIMCSDCGKSTKHKPAFRSPWVDLSCVACGAMNGRVASDPTYAPERPKPAPPARPAKVFVRALNNRMNRIVDESLFGPREFRQFD